jgi:phospholipid/cholesterol/gamma-HCH transport system permease protein
MLMAIIGGGIFCWLGLDIPPVTFVQRIREVVPITDLWRPDQGAGVRLHHRAGRLLPGHAGRQRQPRRSASHHRRGGPGIFLVIVLDAFFAVFFSSIGWI